MTMLLGPFRLQIVNVMKVRQFWDSPMNRNLGELLLINIYYSSLNTLGIRLREALFAKNIPTQSKGTNEC